VFRHIIRFDHKRSLTENLITLLSFRLLVCTLDDTSIVKAKASETQDKEGDRKGTEEIRITSKSNGWKVERKKQIQDANGM